MLLQLGDRPKLCSGYMTVSSIQSTLHVFMIPDTPHVNFLFAVANWSADLKGEIGPDYAFPTWIHLPILLPPIVQPEASPFYWQDTALCYPK